MDENVLITRFVEQYFSVKSALDNGDMEKAQAEYHLLLKAYEGINNSSLDSVHKEMAYQQIVSAHKGIEEHHADSSSYNMNYVAVAVVLVILSTVIMINPQLVGLVVYDGKQVQDLNIAFVESSERKLSLRAAPSSLSVSGRVTGEGTARLYADTGTERLLVFDKDVVPLMNDTGFSGICLDTCALDTESSEVTLVAELSGTILSIDQVAYAVDVNTPPSYRGPLNAIQLSGGKELELKDYFSDSDGDPLVFVALPVDGLSTELSGSLLKITPQRSGTFEVPVIASDPKFSTRVVLKVES